jgi:hypothetical protein
MKTLIWIHVFILWGMLGSSAVEKALQDVPPLREDSFKAHIVRVVIFLFTPYILVYNLVRLIVRNLL